MVEHRVKSWQIESFIETPFCMCEWAICTQANFLISLTLSMPGRKSWVNIDWSNRSLAVTGCAGGGGASGAGVINWLGRRKSGLGWAEEGGNCISWWIGVQGTMSVSWVSVSWFYTEKQGNREFLGGCSMYAAAQFISSRRLIKWSIMWGGQCLADLFSLLCWFDVLLKRLSLKIVMATS